ncbi:hypothetical protein RGUI_0748 [Rhodovulum sp. P5]|uniref:YceD family protein n=1 Tax=Rhodovulum sp. P5 TaxID=1564506 RepID=UPI0009C20FD6|nr:YceD family protein [Rhodovulum sp. P5]ARE38889.1 hypothetical protein RGUI_0748 [Rhodovulum sp. P5]
MPEITDTKIRLARLSERAPTRFRIVPDAESCAEIAERLGLSALRKLRLEGELVPEGRADWRLAAHLGATVVQPCVVTLAPVTTRIETDVTRVFRARMPDLPSGDEIAMPEDDTEEPLPDVLDLSALLEEVLALALPLYPRAEDAELGEAVYAPPGAKALRDADVKPFAALADLKKKLDG